MAYEESSRTEVTIIAVTIIAVKICIFLGLVSFVIFALCDIISTETRKNLVPSIDLASMTFNVFNITETRLSAKWDLSIRIPDNLPLSYICLQGDLQASFIYKNITLATSSPQKYYNLENGQPQILAVSAVVSQLDIGGLIGKDIEEDIKEKKGVKFRSRFSLTDCRKKTTGILSYECHEATLRFGPGSEMIATVFENNLTCISI